MAEQDGRWFEVFGTSNPELRTSDHALERLADFFSILLSFEHERRYNLADNLVEIGLHGCWS